MSEENQRPQQGSRKPGLIARQTVATIITRVLDDGRGLDGLLDTRHGPAPYRVMSPVDQNLVRAIATTVFRHRGEIDYALGKVMDRKPPKRAKHLIHTFYTAAAQILFMDVPDSAAVDLAVTSLRNDERSSRFAGFGNAVLRRLSKEKETLLSQLSPLEKSRLNTPGWMWKRLRRDYGKEQAGAIITQHMLESVLDVTLTSSEKPNLEQWAETLGGVALSTGTIRTAKRDKVATWPGYEDGKWWIQDAAAALPAHLLGDIAGKDVLDLCAAPGGKTAQLASAGANVTALEKVASRFARLRQNLDRLNLKAKLTEGDLLEWQPEKLFDAVLLDAPCSSTGTIRRHPDVQWAKSDAIVEELAALQLSMIKRSADFLKPGGVLVFANCSLHRAEGEDLVAQLIKISDQTGLVLQPLSADDVFGLSQLITGQGTLRSLPCHLEGVEAPEAETSGEKFKGLDGFFAAKFIKSA